MKYPKINSLWKREDITVKKKRHELIVGDYSLEEFGLIKKWVVQEKIDGTNIRIHYSIEDREHTQDPIVEFDGRTDNAQIPKPLLKYLREHFTVERMASVFKPGTDVLLFGEGYGPKIQSGGNYRTDTGFILFDIRIGNFWLKQEDVKNIALALQIPYAPIIGIMTEQEIVDYVKSKPLSLCSVTPQVMEGIIARTEPMLLLRNGDRLIWKLKCVDFK